MKEFTVKPIAYIRSDFKEKFGIPRQSGRAPSLTAEIVFTTEYRHPDALRGIEGFSHLWLIFDFSKAHRKEWSPTVRPPRLGGQYPRGCVCKPFPFPSQSHRTFLCKTFARGRTGKRGLRAYCFRGRFVGRHSHP